MKKKIALVIISAFLTSYLLTSAYGVAKAGSTCPKSGMINIYSGKKFTCIKSGKKLVWDKGVLIKKNPIGTIPTPSPTPNSITATELLEFPKELDKCEINSAWVIGRDQTNKLVYLSCGPDLKLHKQNNAPEIDQNTGKEVIPTDSTTYKFNSYCDKDPFVPSTWKTFQDNLYKNNINGCAPPYRYVISKLTDEKPRSLLTSRNQLLSPSQCYMKRNSPFEFLRANNALLKPSMKVMVVPFATLDYPTINDPALDWGLYVNWISNSLENMTDVPSHYVFDIAPKYLSIPINLRDYSVGQQDLKRGDSVNDPIKDGLQAEILKIADPIIDFSSYDAIMFVTPRNVSRNVMTMVGAFAPKTNEKHFLMNSIITSYIDDFGSEEWNPREPFGFIHEMMHIWQTADDYYGNSNGDFPIGNSPIDFGIGNWGNMSGAMTEHLAWDKWAAGMISDSQVLCVSPTSVTVNWIKPSTVKGQYEKLILVPINENEMIGIESIRNSGFNYKIPKSQLGAIVYKVYRDNRNPNSYYGINLKVFCPTNRPCTESQDMQYGGFHLAGAALKLDDYVELLGMKITLVESGDFGDVVRVEKVG